MTSKDIYRPTYLYIKRHSITGKLYFGKTIRNPENYLGSGLRWKRHIEKHGKEHVETLWYCLFLDQESITEFAMNFSIQNNITESEDWLNMRPENGIDGNSPGTKYSSETRRKMSESGRGKTLSEITRQKLSDSIKNKYAEPFYKSKFSSIRKGVKKPVVMCPYCGKEGGKNVMIRWHFDNCINADVQVRSVIMPVKA